MTSQQLYEFLSRGRKAQIAVDAAIKNAVEIEADLHADIMRWCDAQVPPWPYVHSRMDKKTRNRKGVSDFIVFAPGGRLLIVECKALDEDLSPAQDLWLKSLQKVGHVVNIVRSMESFLYLAQP